MLHSFPLTSILTPDRPHTHLSHPSSCSSYCLPSSSAPEELLSLSLFRDSSRVLHPRNVLTSKSELPRDGHDTPGQVEPASTLGCRCQKAHPYCHPHPRVTICGCGVSLMKSWSPQGQVGRSRCQPCYHQRPQPSPSTKRSGHRGPRTGARKRWRGKPTAGQLGGPSASM